MADIILSRPLVLEGAVRSPDSAGGFTRNWEPLGVLWADVRPRTGREVAGANLTLARVSYKIVVRGAPQGAPSRPLAGQRFRDGSRIFVIRAVTESRPRGKFLTCFADEELAV